MTNHLTRRGFGAALGAGAAAASAPALPNILWLTCEEDSLLLCEVTPSTLLFFLRTVSVFATNEFRGMNRRLSLLLRICGLALVCTGLLVILGIAGCGRTASRPWNLLNITGHMPALEFTLTRDDGQSVTQKSYLGEPVLLYFGYTHCRDVCPTTLADLATAIKQLGPDANQVRVLFVSVDPARDTPAVLKSYVNVFGPWFVGLTEIGRAHV